MFVKIPSIYSVSSYNKPNLSKPSFGISDFSLKKEDKLSDNEFDNFLSLSKIYDSLIKYFSTLNGGTAKKIKTLYPNIDSTNRTKGFIFNNNIGLDGKNVQVVKYNYKNNLNLNNKDEVLTLNLLDENNETLVRYRILDDKSVIIYSDNESLLKFKKNPFSDNKKKKIDYSNCMKLLQSEMEQFQFYTKNAKEILKLIPSESKNLNILNLLSKLVNNKEFLDLKNEILSLYEIYNETSDLLGIGKIHGASDLKNSYFNMPQNTRVKGYLFKNIGKKQESYNITSLRRSYDNAIFKISIYNSQDDLVNTIVFFDDGKIAKQKVVSPESNYLRSQNLEVLSVNDNLVKELDEILDLVKFELSKFKEYVISERTAKNDRKMAKQVEKLPVATKVDKDNKTKVSKKVKPVRTKKTIKQQKLNPSNTKAITENVNVTPRLYTSNAQIISDIEKIFSTPIEKRSPHLIHEILPSGRIFEGRFRLQAKDGAEIIVSRVKSPKYVDFTYYSINIRQGEKSVTINFDPTNGRIIKSNGDKPIITNGVNIEYISKPDFIAQNPMIKCLDNYLSEITDFRQSEKIKYIKLKFMNNKKQENIDKYNKEIIKLLSNDPEVAI